MPEIHFNRDVLERFVDGELPSEEARQIERHLAVCSDCRDRTDEISVLLKLEVLDSWLHPGYDEAFERAAVGAAERLEALLNESRSTEDLLAELLRETPTGRRVRIRHDERFHSLKLCQLLQARSRENWFSDPAVALELADLAVVVAQHLDTGRYGSSLVEDSRALSLAYLGNAFRLTSDLWRAEQALRQAWTSHVEAGEDLSTEIELLDFTCSLRNVQGRFDEAARLSDREIAIYREGQDHHLEGATLIHKALVLGYNGQFEDAISLVRAGLARINVDRDPRLLLSGMHNLIGFLSRAGAPEKARSVLAKNRFLYDQLGDRMDLARLCWLEGHIAGGLGRVVQAANLLHDVRDFFLECGFGVDVFSVSLDLAGMYAQNRQRQQARRVLGDVIPLGEALGLGPDVFLARLLYEQLSRA